MRVVVDAWNVLHVQGVLPPGLAGLGLAGLGRLMLATRWGRSHITLACDGPIQDRPEGVPSAIHIIWSGTGKEADDIIEDLIERSTAPRQMTIVSSDNRLRKAAKRRRCKNLNSEQFLRTILDDLAANRTPMDSPDPPDTPDTPDAPDAPDAPPPDLDSSWEDQFGLNRDELESMKTEVEAEEFGDLMPQIEPSQLPPSARDHPPPPRRDADSATVQPPVSFPPSLIEQAMRIARGD